jgi:hypothetical protein
MTLKKEKENENEINNMNDKNKVIDHFVGALQEAFEKNQQRDNQYVVEYRKVSDDSLIGYHLSSFCQVGQNRLDGKRYSGDNPYSQLQTIHKNLTSVLTVGEDSDGLFDGLKRNIKENYFSGLGPEDVYLNADYLEEGVAPQKFVFTKVGNDE